MLYYHLVNKKLFKFYYFFTDTFLEKIWQRWDRNAARRIDSIAAISNVVKERVKRYYDIECDVIARRPAGKPRPSTVIKLHLGEFFQAEQELIVLGQG